MSERDNLFIVEKDDHEMPESTQGKTLCIKKLQMKVAGLRAFSIEQKNELAHLRVENDRLRIENQKLHAHNHDLHVGNEVYKVTNYTVNVALANAHELIGQLQHKMKQTPCTPVSVFPPMPPQEVEAVLASTDLQVTPQEQIEQSMLAEPVEVQPVQAEPVEVQLVQVIAVQDDQIQANPTPTEMDEPEPVPEPASSSSSKPKSKKKRASKAKAVVATPQDPVEAQPDPRSEDDELRRERERQFEEQKIKLQEEERQRQESQRQAVEASRRLAKQREEEREAKKRAEREEKLKADEAKKQVKREARDAGKEAAKKAKDDANKIAAITILQAKVRRFAERDTLEKTRKVNDVVNRFQQLVLKSSIKSALETARAYMVKQKASQQKKEQKREALKLEKAAEAKKIDQKLQQMTAEALSRIVNETMTPQQSKFLDYCAIVADRLKTGSRGIPYIIPYKNYEIDAKVGILHCLDDDLDDVSAHNVPDADDGSQKMRFDVANLLDVCKRVFKVTAESEKITYINMAALGILLYPCPQVSVQLKIEAVCFNLFVLNQGLFDDVNQQQLFYLTLQLPFNVDYQSPHASLATIAGWFDQSEIAVACRPLIPYRAFRGDSVTNDYNKNAMKRCISSTFADLLQRDEQAFVVARLGKATGPGYNYDNLGLPLQTLYLPNQTGQRTACMVEIIEWYARGVLGRKQAKK